MAERRSFICADDNDPLVCLEFGICQALSEYLEACRMVALWRTELRVVDRSDVKMLARLNRGTKLIEDARDLALNRLLLAAAVHSCCPEKMIEQVKEHTGMTTTARLDEESDYIEPEACAPVV